MDDETFEGFCEECGEEFEAEEGGGSGSGSDEEEDRFKNIVVGVITEAEPIPKKEKLSKLTYVCGGQ